MKCIITSIHNFLFFLDKNILRFFFNLGVKVTLQTYVYLSSYNLLLLGSTVLKTGCCNYTLQVYLKIWSTFYLGFLLTGISSLVHIAVQVNRNKFLNNGSQNYLLPVVVICSPHIVLYKFTGKPIWDWRCILLEAAYSKREMASRLGPCLGTGKAVVVRIPRITFPVETPSSSCLSVRSAQVEDKIQHKLKSKFRFDNCVPNASLLVCLLRSL